MPSFSQAGAQRLRDFLAQESKKLPSLAVEVASADKVLFSGYSGLVDPLDEASEQVDDSNIWWFASTTKLLTAVAALRLVDAGVLSLDTPMSKYFPQFAPPYQIIRSIDPASGEPTFETSNEEITVLHLMNQTSGFGLEMGPEVQGWKKWSGKATGHTNTCKKDNLMPIPPTELPGRRFEYGNGSEWLGLLIQEATGKDFNDVLRSQIFDPLGMKSTTFYPFSPAQREKLLPIRWLERKEDGSFEFEKLVSQCDLLKLPRTREDIEYPLGGGGIYTQPADYLKLLQHLLSHRLSATPSSKLNLSLETLNSLFVGTLPPDELGHKGLGMRLEKFGLSSALDLDWSTGMCIFEKDRTLPGGARGRSKGSAGWSGAAGTEYWIDASKGIAVVCSTHALPVLDPEIQRYKDEVERLVYEALEE
ncbi:hypothetical protein JCM8547_006888 [Rhodosporidiobolus lusitaniae]